MNLEICVDSVQSAMNAVDGGADRLELCSSLAEGGLTPTAAFLMVVKECIKPRMVPLFCMVRPRGGPMQYSHYERNVILGDIKDLRTAGADGFVFGALTPDGKVDTALCKDVIEAAEGVPCTFHRAFDKSINPVHQLEMIISLGFQRILTSGCKTSAIEGSPMIKHLLNEADNRIIIMAGAGITSSNCADLIKSTGVREVHCSAKVKKIFSSMGCIEAKMGSTDDSSLYITSAEQVRLIRNILNHFN